MESIFCPDASMKLQPKTGKSDWKLHCKSFRKVGSTRKSKLIGRCCYPALGLCPVMSQDICLLKHTALVHAACGWPSWTAWLKTGVKLWLGP